MTLARKPIPDFSALRHVHIVGVCGTLMGAFAAFLKRRGLRVTGSDQNVYPPMSDVLQRAGVELLTGFSAENLSKSGSPDLVVIGNVIRRDNPEAVAALSGGRAYASLPEVMESLLLSRTRNLVVAGTHGKTTTSSLLAYVLREAGRKPSFFIGGVSADLPDSFHVESDVGEQGLFVLEGDEYDTSFWDKVPKFNHYLPDDVILTSVEFDHADIYADLAAVVRAFEGLVTRIRPGGHLIACADYSEVRTVARLAKVPVVFYSRTSGKDVEYYPENIREVGGQTVFEVMERGKVSGTVALNLPGHHNVMNALAVWIQARILGVSAAEISRGLKLFKGVKRRQEIRAEKNGVTVIDDFAHHPTAVFETLNALRARYPGRRLVAVFEPRSATSRRKIFQNEYVKAFSAADRVFIAAPFDQSRIDPREQFSSQQLVEDLVKSSKKEAHCFVEVDRGVDELAESSKSGDVIAVLSNGGFGGFIPKLIERI